MHNMTPEQYKKFVEELLPLLKKYDIPAYTRPGQVERCGLIIRIGPIRIKVTK